MLIGYDRGHPNCVLLDDGGMIMTSQDVQIVEPKEQKDHNVDEFDLVEFDLTDQGVIFDVAHAHPGDTEDGPGGGMHAAEDSDLVEIVSPKEDNQINLDGLT